MHCIQRWQLSSKEVPVFSPEYTSRWRLFTFLKPFLRFWRFTHFGSLCDVNVLLQKVIFTAMLKLSTAYQIKGSAALTNKFYTKKNLPFFKTMRKFWKWVLQCILFCLWKPVMNCFVKWKSEVPCNQFNINMALNEQPN